MNAGGDTSNTHSLRQHIRATLVLGVPITLAHIAQMLIGVVDTIMLGWLGTEELAAGTLAFQLYFIFLIFGLGLAAAMVPLIASALGQDNPKEVRRSARMGLWGLMGLAFLFQIPLYFTSEILVGLGQAPELAELAQGYMRIAQWSMIPAFIFIGLRNFLTSIEKATTVLVITLIVAALNGLLNYMFIFGNFGAPRMEMEGAAVATLASNLAGVLVTGWYVTRSPDLARYELFVRFWRPDWPALKKICTLGLPISFMIFAEAGLFSAASVMIGWIGIVALAAHGIVLQIASISFMIPLGLSQAASVRIGYASGRKDDIGIGRAGYAAMLLALSFSIFAALLFWIVPEPLIRLFLEDKNVDALDVVAYAVPLLWMAAAFQIADAGQAVAGGNLRGLQDTQVPMIIAIICYWVVGLPIGYVLAFPLGYGGVGVWCGLAAGLICAALALSHRFSRREALGLAQSISQ